MNTLVSLNRRVRLHSRDNTYFRPIFDMANKPKKLNL